MKNKFTAGPWRVGNTAMGDPQTVWAAEIGICIGTFFDNRYGEDAPPRTQANANGRLISAAPELLLALEALAKVADNVAWERSPLGMLPEPIMQARAAIAKARG